MSKAEFEGYWGAANLVQWSPVALQGASIPAEASRFLQEIGLPCRLGPLVHPVMTFGPVVGTAAAPGVQIGAEEGLPFCVAPDGSVIVVEVDVNVESPVASGVSNPAARNEAVRLVNSDLRRFGECLIWYHQFLTTPDQATPAEEEQVVARLRTHITFTDPRAVAEPENYWAVILAQAEAGTA